MIENTQRDLNIALMNELALIFDRIGIDTHRGARGGRHQVELPAVPAGPRRRPLHRRRSVLPDAQGGEARLPPAGDPRRARINDGMGKYVAEQTVKQHDPARLLPVKEANVNVLGLTFKENVPDLRNSRVIDVVRELESFGVEVLRARPGRRCPKEARARVRHPTHDVGGAAAGARPSWRRSRTTSTATGRSTRWSSKLAPNGVYVDVKSRADAAALRDARDRSMAPLMTRRERLRRTRRSAHRGW